MKLYVCKDHDHHWPVGVASIVLAKSEEDAIKLLDKELVACGLKPYKDKPYKLSKIPQTKPLALVLCDGNY